MQKKSDFSKQILKCFLHIIGLCITVFGVSLTIKSQLGNNAWDAFSLLLSNLTGVKIGYIAMFMNGSTIVGQILIEREKFEKRQYLQVLNVFAAGKIFNFFVYDLLGNFTVSSLPLKIVTIFAGCVIGGLGIAIMVETDFVRNSLEGLCNIVAIRVSSTLGRIRKCVDAVLIVVIVCITVLSKTSWVIGIGTVICMIVYGTSIDFFRNRINKMHINL